MIKSNLVQTGLSPSEADAIGGRVASGLTAAGTSQASAVVCPSDSNVFTTVGPSSGCILGAPAVGSTLNLLNVGDEIQVCNFGANALSVYPPVGGTILNGATNAAVTLIANTCARYRHLGNGSFSL